MGIQYKEPYIRYAKRLQWGLDEDLAIDVDGDDDAGGGDT
jgi:hypothetical protein